MQDVKKELETVPEGSELDQSCSRLDILFASLMPILALVSNVDGGIRIGGPAICQRSQRKCVVLGSPSQTSESAKVRNELVRFFYRASATFAITDMLGRRFFLWHHSPQRSHPDCRELPNEL